jgi:3-oxoadipate enol-lactonase
MTGPAAGDVVVNGVRLNFRLEGPEGAPIVALVNSLGTDLTMWQPQIAALTRRYRVLRHDTRGHGRSAAPPAPYTMDMLADDVLGLLSHVGAERFHVVGISLGGLEALAVGLRRPAGLASIAICDSRIDVPPEGARAMDDRVRLVREQGMAPLAEAMIQRWFTPPTLAAKPDYLEAVRRMLLATSIEGFAGCAAAIKHSGLSARVAALQLPVLFLVGDQDAALPVALMQQVQAQVPDARSAIIQGAGHLSNLEQPAAFNEALLAFLDQVA